MNKTYFFLLKMLLVVFIINGTLHVYAKAQSAITVQDAVSAFYKARGNRLFWFDGSQGEELRRQLLLKLENSGTQGLDINKYPVDALREQSNIAVSGTMKADRLYTSAAIAYMKDMIKGDINNGITGSDALSSAETNDTYKTIIAALNACVNANALDSIIKSMEPVGNEYLILKSALALAYTRVATDTATLLKVALNNYRRVHNPHYKKCIVINVPAGTLRYYEYDSLILEMKVVTGKASTPTPRFTAYCNQVVLYPYWNVPRSIAVNEILPVCKRTPAILSVMNMQVLDAKGKLQDPEKINWKAYNKQNFPYRFRQSTGCDNALGLIKFNIESPYGVYLHDTNNKLSFAKKDRFFSHGCIRLEKPVALAELLLQRKIDSHYLAACLQEEKPLYLQLTSPVPVFVVYVRAQIETGQTIVYYNDIYKLN